MSYSNEGGESYQLSNLRPEGGESLTDQPIEISFMYTADRLRTVLDDSLATPIALKKIVHYKNNQTEITAINLQQKKEENFVLTSKTADPGQLIYAFRKGDKSKTAVPLKITFMFKNIMENYTPPKINTASQSNTDQIYMTVSELKKRVIENPNYISSDEKTEPIYLSMRLRETGAAVADYIPVRDQKNSTGEPLYAVVKPEQYVCASRLGAVVVKNETYGLLLLPVNSDHFSNQFNETNVDNISSQVNHHYETIPDDQYCTFRSRFLPTSPYDNKEYNSADPLLHEYEAVLPAMKPNSVYQSLSRSNSEDSVMKENDMYDGPDKKPENQYAELLPIQPLSSSSNDMTKNVMYDSFDNVPQNPAGQNTKKPPHHSSFTRRMGKWVKANPKKSVALLLMTLGIGGALYYLITHVATGNEDSNAPSDPRNSNSSTASPLPITTITTADTTSQDTTTTTTYNNAISTAPTTLATITSTQASNATTATITASSSAISSDGTTAATTITTTSGEIIVSSTTVTEATTSTVSAATLTAATTTTAEGISTSASDAITSGIMSSTIEVLTTTGQPITELTSTATQSTSRESSTATTTTVTTTTQTPSEITTTATSTTTITEPSTTSTASSSSTTTTSITTGTTTSTSTPTTTPAPTTTATLAPTISTTTSTVFSSTTTTTRRGGGVTTSSTPAPITTAPTINRRDLEAITLPATPTPNFTAPQRQKIIIEISKSTATTFAKIASLAENAFTNHGTSVRAYVHSVLKPIGAGGYMNKPGLTPSLLGSMTQFVNSQLLQSAALFTQPGIQRAGYLCYGLPKTQAEDLFGLFRKRFAEPIHTELTQVGLNGEIEHRLFRSIMDRVKNIYTNTFVSEKLPSVSPGPQKRMWRQHQRVTREAHFKGTQNNLDKIKR